MSHMRIKVRENYTPKCLTTFGSVTLYRAHDSAYKTISPYPWAWFSDNLEYVTDYQKEQDGKDKVISAFKVESADLELAQPEDIERVLKEAGIESFGEVAVANGITEGDIWEFGYGKNDEAVRDALLEAGYNCFAFRDEIQSNPSAPDADVLCILDLSLLIPVKQSEANMSSLNIYAQESKKNEAESVSAREFWDKFIKDQATDLLASYEMNDTQGVPGSGEGWEGNDVRDIPNTYSDGTTREDFNAELRREFIGNLGYFDSTGYHDGELSNLIDKAFDYASDSYCMDNNLDSAPEEGTDGYDDYMDAIFDFLSDSTIVGFASIEMKERSLRGVDYTLTARITREDDSGDVMGDTLEIEMNLTADQLTQVNADKFLNAVQEKFGSYSFSDGDESINIDAE